MKNLQTTKTMQQTPDASFQDSSSELSVVQTEILYPGASVSDQLASIFQLRQQIYCEQMGIPSGGHCVQTDSYDAYSHNMRLLQDGALKGVVRFTCASRGQMEIEVQQQSWREKIAEYDRSEICEVTRLMFEISHRGHTFVNLVIYNLFYELLRNGIRYIFLAGKQGSLEKRYSGFGAKPIDTQYRPYLFNGKPLGLYKLMLIDLGAPGSITWQSVLNSRERVNSELLKKRLLPLTARFT